MLFLVVLEFQEPALLHGKISNNTGTDRDENMVLNFTWTHFGRQRPKWVQIWPNYNALSNHLEKQYLYKTKQQKAALVNPLVLLTTIGKAKAIRIMHVSPPSTTALNRNIHFRRTPTRRQYELQITTKAINNRRRRIWDWFSARDL